ncbi:hypothetical protein [Variovorax sp. KK3]|uniref:hypothetical protein n=1 Tax=Variovorax sp. KK3 TaxID=1855728 RepID=UPI00118118A0|nr:hypothetical protein [Variovorax sp. KK3]
MNEDWFAQVGSHCSGLMSLNEAVSRILDTPLAVEAASPAGCYVALLPASSIENGDGSLYLQAEIVLETSNSLQLRNLLVEYGDATVPYGLRVFTATILDKIEFIGPQAELWKFVASFAFDQLYDFLDAVPLQLRTLSGYIAVGGKVQRQTFMTRTSAGRFLEARQIYAVDVGLETRSFVLSDCLFPVKVVASEFEAKTQFATKQLKQRLNSSWQIFDVGTNRWETELTYLCQDAGNYFFESNEIEYDRLIGKTTHKVSFEGGSWFRKRSDSTDFVRVYEKVTAR